MKKKNDLGQKLREQKELQDALALADKAVAAEKASLSPEQGEKVLLSIENWAKSFCRGGHNWEAFEAIKENIRLLKIYDAKYLDTLSKDLFARSHASKYVIENLLSGTSVLNESAEL